MISDVQSRLGTIAYAIFLGTFLYAIGFSSRFLVPKHVNSGGDVPPLYAIVIDLALLGLFAVQHSGMARRGFKHVLTRFVSPVIERSTYVLCSSLVLIALFWFWQPIHTVVWQIDNLAIALAIQLLSMPGWLLVVYSTFLISHFELFGLKQVVMNFVGRASPQMNFARRLLSPCPPPAVSRLHHRVLGDADDDGRQSAVRCRGHGLHLHRHCARGPRPGRNLRRAIPAIQGARGDAAARRVLTRRGESRPEGGRRAIARR